MIDDKKIEAAANKHIETEYARYNSGEVEEEIVSWLNQHIFFESGYDITEGPFPLPATIGEGFRFQSLDFLNKNVVDYVTKANRKMISVC